MTKVFLFGIDGAPPELIFDKWNESLPNIKKLMQSGTYAKMNSAIPPSTIVAWNSMISGRDTSEIGVFSYTKKGVDGQTRLVDSKDIKCKLIWDYLSENGKKGVSLFVPLSYPVKPIDGGVVVSGFLTPGVDSNCTYPEDIKEKIKSMSEPETFFDVSVGLAGHKGLEVGPLIEKTYKMTDMQLDLVDDLAENQEWDFFMSVMIGSDRLQHMIWRHFDETHRRFIPDSEHKDALKNYYIYLDKKLGELLEKYPDAVFIVASDHGMIKQEGKININNWLIDNGYMVLKDDVNLSKKTRFKTDFVDMEKSIAYGGGAYNARVYINKEKITADGLNYEKILNEISKKIKEIPDDKGNKINTQIYVANEIYGSCSDPGCPDLTIYFDNLRWASNPDLGQDGLYSWETAVGADSAGHSRQGCFIISGDGIKNSGLIDDIDIRQVMPTVLEQLGIEKPSDIKVEGVKVR